MINPRLLWLAVGLVACGPLETRQLERLSTGLQLRANEPARLAAASTLRTPGWFNELCAQPLPPYALDSVGFTIVGLDGNAVHLQAVLRGAADTVVLDRASYSFADVDFICLHSPDSLAAAYEAVELMASHDLALGRVEWRSYDK